jgi:hypothetical protein
MQSHYAVRHRRAACILNFPLRHSHRVAMLVSPPLSMFAGRGLNKWLALRNSIANNEIAPWLHEAQFVSEDETLEQQQWQILQ